MKNFTRKAYLAESLSSVNIEKIQSQVNEVDLELGKDNEKVIRYETPEGVGIYQAARKVLGLEEWKKLLSKLKENAWLPLPESIKGKSYFTPEGEKKFRQYDLPLLEKIVPNYRRVEIPLAGLNVIYKDKMQVQAKAFIRKFVRISSIADWFTRLDWQEIERAVRGTVSAIMQLRNILRNPRSHDMDFRTKFYSLLEKNEEVVYYISEYVFSKAEVKMNLVVLKGGGYEQNLLNEIGASVYSQVNEIEIKVPFLFLISKIFPSEDRLKSKIREIIFHEVTHLYDPKVNKKIQDEHGWKSIPPKHTETLEEYYSLPSEEDAFIGECLPQLKRLILQYRNLPYNELAHKALNFFKAYVRGVFHSKNPERYKKRLKKFMRAFDSLYNQFVTRKTGLLQFTRKAYQTESPSSLYKEGMQSGNSEVDISMTLDERIQKWIETNVPKDYPTDDSSYGRCAAYAAALVDTFGGTLIRGMNTQLKPGDTYHFWAVINGKEYDPTGHWYPGGSNYNGEPVSIQKNIDYFGSDPVFQRLTKGIKTNKRPVLEAAHWTDRELKILKEVYRKARDRGIPHNQIYQKLSEFLPHSHSGIKQRLETLYKEDKELQSYKYENWSRDRIIEELKKIYLSGEPISRKALPPKLEYQITNHSLPKAITRGFEVFFDSFDYAVAEAIFSCGYRRNEQGELDKDRPLESLKDTWHYYRTNEKKNNPWTKEEIILLFRKAHEAGLPLTKSFFTSHALVYKPLLQVSRSLDGLRKSVDRLGLTWGDIVIEAVPDYESWYDETGKAMNSTGELRVIRFLDLMGIPYRRSTRLDKIAVTEPEIIESGYRNFIPDIFIQDRNGNDIGIVEIYGAIADSGAALGELAQKYHEKILAKEKVYKQLPLVYIAIHDNQIYGSELSDEKLKEKFAQFLNGIDEV